jgi:hypothetical protein
MSIDLTKLISKRKYVIPVKAADLCNKVLEQLKIDGPWLISAQRPKSAVFSVDWEESYVMWQRVVKGKEKREKAAAAARKEYLEYPIQCIGSIQGITVGNIPARVSYIIAEEMGNRCAIEATCKPAMYLKIVRKLEYGEVDLQDVRIQSEEFLDQIFIGGLRGKEIQEVKEGCRWEFLFNDTHVRQITDQINEMLSKATSCVLFFGWFGTEYIPKLKELKEAGLTIKAITHARANIVSQIHKYQNNRKHPV